MKSLRDGVGGWFRVFLRACGRRWLIRIILPPAERSPESWKGPEISTCVGTFHYFPFYVS